MTEDEEENKVLIKCRKEIKRVNSRPLLTEKEGGKLRVEHHRCLRHQVTKLGRGRSNVYRRIKRYMTSRSDEYTNKRK
jgi:hypothetical protein